MKATVFHSGMHLKEEYVLPPQTVCPLCSFHGDRPQALCLQLEPDVFLLACPNCGGFSASRLPTQEALRAYYSRYYEGAIYQNSEKVTFNEPRRFARHLLQNAKPFLQKKNLTILDFGGGDGNLSLAIAQLLLNERTSHVDIVLVDYNAGPSRSSCQNISLVCHATLDSANGEGL